MSDNRLFRWNIKAGLRCAECEGTVFLEEIASQEIFCSFCGYIWARSRSEWPTDWEQDAFYGVEADEMRWGEGVRVLGRSMMEDIVVQDSAPTEDGIGAKDIVSESAPSNLATITTNHQTHSDVYNTTREILDVIVVEMGPPPPEITRSISRPPNIPSPSPSNITQPVSIPHPAYKTPPPSISSRTNTPPTPVIPASSTERSVFNPKPPPRTRLPNYDANDAPRQIGKTPLHSVDLDLLTLARQFDLSEEAVIAAKHIILRYERQFSRAQLTVIARAALFAACRQVGIAKTFKEFDSDFDWNKKALWHKAFKTIDALLKNDAHGSTGLDNTADATACQFIAPVPILPASFRVTDFITSESKSLSLSSKIRSRALAISQHPAVDFLFSGKRPSGTAAAILSFAAECEEHYIGSAPYAQAANVSTQSVVAGQKMLLRCVEEMAGRGPLPKPFRAKWNTAGYTNENEGEDYGGVIGV